MKIGSALTTLALACALGACASTETRQEESPSAAAGGVPTASAASSTAVDGARPSGAPIAEGKPGGLAQDAGRPDLSRSVYYEFDRDDVKAEYRPLVESHARWLRANPQARITVEGNSDERGSREYNLALGQRRAQAVASLMVLLGAKPEQIEAVSFGEEKPRAAGTDENAWAENRRSDFAGR